MTIQEVINSIDFNFLKANRFWALIIGATATYLKAKNIIGIDEMVLIDTIAFAFIGIRTFDRAAEKVSEAK